MTNTATACAKLIFKGKNLFLSIDRLSDVARKALLATGAQDVRTGKALLTGLELVGNDLGLRLEIEPGAEECIVALALESGAIDKTALKIRLAALLFEMTTDLPADQIIWLDTTARLPRELFLKTLAPELAPEPVAETLPAAQDDAAPAPSTDSATVVSMCQAAAPIAPRRIARTETAPAAPRPDAQSHRDLLATLLPPVARTARPIAVNANTAVAPCRFDAHVAAFETNLRMALLHEPDEDELEALAAEIGPVPVEARLSTWAVSLTVATVSLPVAAPVMIDNIARGEDMRVASLGMALAGFFLALDTSGATAGVLQAF